MPEGTNTLHDCPVQNTQTKGIIIFNKRLSGGCEQ